MGALDRRNAQRGRSGAAAADEATPVRRRLSDDDREAIRRWRSPRPGEERPPGDAVPRQAATLGTLPDLPDIFEDDEISRSRLRPGGLGNRALILGGILFLGMAVLILPALAIPGLGFGDDPSPTPPPSGDGAIGGGAAQVLGAATAQATRSAPVAGGERGVVCLDAGHGGWDMGFRRLSTAGAPQMDEASINLGMAWMLEDRLEAEGFTVVMTRTTGSAVNPTYADVNGDGQTAKIGTDGMITRESQQAALRDELQARINICNEAEADVLISLHMNGYSDASVRGYEVLYTAERPFGQLSFDLATFVDRELNAHYTEAGFQTEARGVKRDTDLQVQKHAYGSERHLIMTGPAVEGPLDRIVPSEMPGVVIEPLFISNDADAAFLAEARNQQTIVDAYADAVLQYFETHPAGG
ncbi:MAG: N-acetylmuramoyl-L-alanine amidase [Chloroflexota bacterium]|nr:N-acetylmuramoyl-L-alanine amidase [Chloroflexota bacterium]